MISVIMGIRAAENRLPEVKRAISSIRAQTESDFELLICDTDSSAGVQNWLNEIATKDFRIQIIRNETCRSLTQKLNLCLKQSQGEFIARMDADDYSYPNRFEKQIKFLKKNPQYCAVGCNVREVSQTYMSVRVLPEEPVIKDFRIKFPFIHPAMMFRRTALIGIGGYSECHWQDGCDDYDLMLRLYANKQKAANLQEVLLDYSILNSQLKKRAFHLYLNESVTRFYRFRELGLLPKWFCYVLKPLIISLIPRRALYFIKVRFLNN